MDCEVFNATRLRAAFLATTALTLLHAVPLRAQSVAAEATPQGGSVVAGSASIAQAPGSTTITQSSARTAINWQSFNVGADASVKFVQPDSSAVALNRVVGPDPSVIAGHIDANGQIVLINQSGVVFTKGAQVNAQSIFVSTSNIADDDFMAGRMNFTGAPAPGAKIENDGQLTARQAGLVGLVAPQVLNNGVITARLGQVILAGASAFTLDFYGDRLISFDVTKAVSAVDVGGKTVPALVTNRGIIIADGGKITMTAVDADALVSELIEAGGTLRADAAGGQAGQVTLAAVGGNIHIAGNILARNNAGTGGSLQVAATGSIAVAGSAVMDASGSSGGGSITLGAALGSVPKAASTSIAAGAQLHADATVRGNGGEVLVNSAEETDFAGTISVTGGAQGGNGGLVDLSTDGVISLGGTVLDTAIDGQAGEVRLDPATLVVGTHVTDAGTAGTAPVTIYGGTAGGGTSYVEASALTSLGGTIVLEAGTSLLVESAVSLVNASALSLVSGNAITVAAPMTLANSLGGTLEFNAGATLEIDAPVQATQLVLDAPQVSEGAAGALQAGTLSGTVSGTALLLSELNSVGTLAGFDAGTLALVDSTSLAIGGTDAAALLELVVNGPLDLAGTLGAATLGGDNHLTYGSGTVALAATALTLGTGGTILAPGGRIAISPNGGAMDVGGTSAGGLTLSSAVLAALDSTAAVLEFGSLTGFVATSLVAEGSLNFGTQALQLGASLLVETAGTLAAGAVALGGATLADPGTLTAMSLTIATPGSFIATGRLNAGTLAGSAGGLISLSGTNLIGTLGGLNAAGLTLDDAQALVIAGAVSVAGGLSLAGSGAVSETGSGALTAASLAGSFGGAIALAGQNSLAVLNGLTATGAILLDDTTPLTISASLATPGELTLLDPGTVTAPGGVQAATLSGTLGAGLFTGANAIGTLSGLTAAGVLALLQPGTLALAGTEAAGQLVLDTGAVSELAGASLAVGTLSGSLTGSALLANAGNSIASLGSLILTGSSLGLDDATSLSINGLVSAGAASLAAPGITVPGTVAVAGALQVQASGSLDVTGSLAAGTLGGSLGGAALLGADDNLGTLANFTASSILLGEPGTLTLGGTVLASGGHADFALGGLQLAGGTLLTGGGTIALDAYDDGELDLGGTTGLGLSAGLLAALDPQATLVLAAGSILTEGALSLATPLLELLTTGSLTMAGTLQAAALDIAASAVNEPVSAVLSVGTLDALGSVASLASLAGIGTLGGVGTPVSISLLGSTNSVGTLANMQAAALVKLIDSAALDVTGQVSAQGVALQTPSLTVAGTLATGTGGDIALFANQLSLAGGSIAAGNGVVAIAPLTPGTNIGLGGGSGLAISQSLLSGISAQTLYLFTTGSISVATSVSAAQDELLLWAGGGVDVTGTLAVPGTLVVANGGVTSAAGAVLQAGTLASYGTLNGAVDLAAGSNSIAALGSLSSLEGVTLVDAIPLTVAGSVAGSAVSLSAAGITLAAPLSARTLVALGSTHGITSTGAGVVNTPTLTGLGSIGGDILLAGGSIGLATGLTASGQLSLADSAALTTGSLAAASITLAASALDLAGNVSTPGALRIGAQGGIVQSGGSLAAGTLQITGGTQAALTAANQIGQLGFATLSGGLALTDAGALTIAGPVNAGSVTLAAAALDLHGTLSAAQVTLAGGSLSEDASGALDTGLLAGSLSGAASLGGGNLIGTLGNFSASTLILQDAQALTLDGGVTAGTLALLAPGLSQTGGALVTSLLSSDGGVINGNALFAEASNSVSALGALSATGALRLNSQGDLALQGNLSAASISLNPTGALVQQAGSVQTGAFSADPSSLVLSGQNQIATLAGLTVSGSAVLDGLAAVTGNLVAQSAALVAPGALAISGNVEVAGNLALKAGGALKQTAGTIAAAQAELAAPDITLSGTDLIGGMLVLDATGNILHTAGALSAGALSGTAGQLASFAAYTDIGTLGSFILQDSLFDLTNDGPLVFTGPLVANRVLLTVEGPLTLRGAATGGLFITGTLAGDYATIPGSQDSVILVNDPASGQEITQTGTFLVNAGPLATRYLGTDSQPATLFLETKQSGDIVFGAYPGGLYAPSLDLVLNAGLDGAATGNLTLRHLEVISARTTSFSGTIDGVTGPTAATNGSAVPFPVPYYRFNACPIGSVNCIILPLQTLPPANPLQNFDLTTNRKRRLNANVSLPGVATRDY